MKIFLYILLFAFIAIQFIHINKTNPKVRTDLKAPENVKKIIKESCYNCHSNETDWPWYSGVAPVSWFVAADVNDGRKRLNFSEWKIASRSKVKEIKKKIFDEINKGEMPPQRYIYLHPAAEITFNELQAIKRWAASDR
ncbi:MAG: heme-binding domain-containing protein [Chlorobi bacterium]|nr:heme-binding domain-containing protein [Chlorobiota bacterium]